MIFSHLEATKLISEVALIGLKNLRPLVVHDCSIWCSSADLRTKRQITNITRTKKIRGGSTGQPYHRN